MRRHASALLLVLTGAALLRVSLLSDLYLRYVKEGLRPLLIASGAVLLLLGLVSVLAGDGRRDPQHRPRSAWLLAPPAAMLLIFAPPALGSYTVAHDGSGAIARRTHFSALPDQGTLDLTLTDFTARAAWDDSHSLAGRTVRLTGFAAPAADGTWQLSRVIVTCCAADARTLKVAIHGITAPPADTWVTVTGVWRPTSGRSAPGLDATALTRIPQPRNPYRDTIQPVLP
ncbi:TIGR03943 family protein [Kitasatospora paracochleata]